MKSDIDKAQDSKLETIGNEALYTLISYKAYNTQ